MSSSYETIEVRPEGAVLHVALNRPAVRNAMSAAMVRELRDVLAAAEAVGTTRVVVLRGRGGHFCAGADLAELAEARARRAAEPEAIARSNAAFGELCLAYASTGLAVVAVLQGTVVGGGLGLACVADVVLADETVVFRLPETALGVVPAQVAPWLVERLGAAEAKRLAVTGASLDAQAALRLRLVHEVHVDAESLEWALGRVLGDILRCAPGALAATKALLAKSRFTPPAALVAEAAEVFARAALGAEGSEGVAAFLARRKPGWAPAGDE